MHRWSGDCSFHAHTTWVMLLPTTSSLLAYPPPPSNVRWSTGSLQANTTASARGRTAHRKYLITGIPTPMPANNVSPQMWVMLNYMQVGFMAKNETHCLYIFFQTSLGVGRRARGCISLLISAIWIKCWEGVYDWDLCSKPRCQTLWHNKHNAGVTQRLCISPRPPQSNVTVINRRLGPPLPLCIIRGHWVLLQRGKLRWRASLGGLTEKMFTVNSVIICYPKLLLSWSSPKGRRTRTTAQITCCFDSCCLVSFSCLLVFLCVGRITRECQAGFELTTRLLNNIELHFSLVAANQPEVFSPFYFRANNT